MNQGNGVVVATHPKLVVQPEFGEIVLLSPNINFSAGESIWITFNPSGGIKCIRSLTDEHIQVMVEEEIVREIQTPAPEDLVFDDWYVV